MRQVLDKLGAMYAFSLATLIFLAAFSVAVTLSGCSPNRRIIESSAERKEPTPSPGPTATPDLKTDIESMRTADFLFIYVFRRKDGGPLDADDKRYAARVIPPEMNRRTISDSGRAIIVGSNFRMPAETLKVLKERFDFEDYSSPAAR
ncbi:MAG: hypothetical protein C4324_02885 [Blastocatellia bacterium]